MKQFNTHTHTHIQYSKHLTFKSNKFIKPVAYSSKINYLNNFKTR